MSLAELTGLSSEQRELLQLLLREVGGDPAKLPILPRESNEPAPLSFAQHRLWYLDQFNAHRSAYNVTKALHIEGRLDGEALQKALDALVIRHEILRTTYHHEDATPFQTVGEARAVELSCFDWRESGLSARDEKVRRLLEDQARRPFDLTSDLMMRAAWVQLDAEEHVLLVTFHHIAADAWSLGIVFPELEEFYKVYSLGREPQLRPLPIQYADYAAWERERLSDGAIQQDLDYWKNKLAGAQAVLDLPTDRPLRAERAMRGAIAQRTLPEPVCTALKRMAGREGATFFVVLLAAFETLLHRYSGQTDFCIGSPITGRNKAETEGLVGFFLNTLVFRCDFSDAPSFREVIRRVRETALEAFAHQEAPFDRLVETLHPQRRAAHSPLFQVMFVLQDAQTHKLNLTGKEARVFEVDLGAARFDLHLTAQDTGKGLHCCLEYDTDLFDRATAERMLGHFETLLLGVLEDPGRPVAAAPILTGSERQQLLVDWTDTARPYSPLCVHELVRQHAARNPGAPAVVYEGHTLTYGDLQRRSELLAGRLRAIGVRNGTLVGLFVERSLEAVVAMLAVLTAGAAYVPLDPAYPKERLAFMVEDGGVEVLLTQSHLKKDLPAPVANVIDLNQFDWDGEGEAIDLPAVPQNSLSYVLYTSGSTGKPKAVAIEHSALVNLLESIRRETGFSESDRLLAVSSLSFDITELDIYMPLISGACFTLASREAVADGNRLAKLLETSRSTFMQATPATWRMLVEAGWQGKADLKILSGGERLPRALANQLLERSRGVWNAYGPTETTIYSTIVKVEAGEDRLSVGRAIGNTQLYVLNSHLQPNPIGVFGELYIGGDGLAREYLFRPELTAEKFIANPFGPGRLYKSGDVMRWRADGGLDFLRRLDDQVKLRGFRIELGEIEAALARHPAVQAVCALIREDSPGDPYIAAYYVAETGQAASHQELREYLRKHLPEFMVPARFVALERFPLTPNRKIDRKALPAPPVEKLVVAAAALPQTPIQQLIAEVWGKALGIDGIGLGDNFFDLGGHSLLSVQVIRDLRRRTGVLLTPRDMVFQSLGQLAALYEERSQAAKRPGGLIGRLSGVVQKAMSKGA
jgi:amino acid adenylation domain-containing protein